MFDLEFRPNHFFFEGWEGKRFKGEKPQACPQTALGSLEVCTSVKIIKIERVIAEGIITKSIPRSILNYEQVRRCTDKDKPPSWAKERNI